MTQPAEPPITVHVTHYVSAAMRGRFERWLKEIEHAAQAFDELSATMCFSPQDGDEGHHVVFRFSSVTQLHRFWQSVEGKRLRGELAAIVSRPSSYRYHNGLEHWMVKAPEDGSPRPPTYKMAVVAYLAIAPLVLLVPPLLMPLFAGLHPLPAQLSITGIIVLLMSYGAMPLATRALSGWLQSS